MPEVLLRLDLDFTARLHAGSGGSEREGVEPMLHSDRLFSALCHAWLECWGEASLTGWIEASRSPEPPVRLSSAFPYVSGSDGGREYLLPKPLLDPTGFEDAAVGSRFGRVLRAAPFIPRDACFSWLAGLVPDYAACAAVARRLTERIRPAMEVHVALDRTDATSEYYRSGSTWFGADAGLYALARVADGSWADRLAAAFRCLGDLGVGGRRGSGHGQFTPRVETVTEDPGWSPCGAGGSGACCLLARLAPEPATAADLLRGSRHQLAESGGWALSAGAQAPHRRVLMLAEGSVLPRWDSGRLVDVTPAGWEGHRVYRSGLGFAVPVGGVQMS